MYKHFVKVLIILVVASFLVYYIFDKDGYSLGLDIAGGSQITYTIDTSGIDGADINNRVESLKSVIEKRVNALGVSEPRLYTTSTSRLTGLPVSHRLVIELPGVTDIEEAVRKIGETPYLEFQRFNQVTREFEIIGLNGGHVSSSSVQFLPGAGGAISTIPTVTVTFNSEGRKLFSELTRDNVGNLLGIFLDGVAISTPVIQAHIPGGVTQISGNFTLAEANELSSSLSLGALPLPIEIGETRTVNGTLGRETIEKSALASLIALLIISIMFVVVYRVAGIISIISLVIYYILVLSIFKGIPVVLTAAGLAGFVISLGFAVDANVLIFERLREELRSGKPLKEGIEIGFSRAWNSIRDANLTSLIIAGLLFWFGTSIVKGFAFTFIIGILTSMFTAYFLTRIFLRVFAAIFKKYNKWLI